MILRIFFNLMFRFRQCKCDLQWETDCVPSESFAMPLNLLEDLVFLKGQTKIKKERRSI